MDHSLMDHSGMDHGGMDHGGMDHGDMNMCSMNMIFTWDYNNLCVIFKSWRITSVGTLLASLIAVIALTAGYEAVREASRRYEERTAKQIEASPNDGETSSLLWSGQSAVALDKQAKLVKAAFYAVQVFYSFFIMLLFMTYNGWIMLAVGVGAFIGYLGFGGSSATKSAACH